MAIVYKTTNLVNGKIYVGVDSNNDPKYLGSGKLLKKAISKYGSTNFSKETLKEFLTSEEAFLYETYLIDKLGAINSKNYYNIKSGGKGGHNNHDYSGENNPMYGKSMRELLISKYGEEEGLCRMNEMRRKGAESTRGQKRIFTEEHCKSISDSRVIFFSRISEEEKKELNSKISTGMKGSNLKRSDEYKEKMSISLKSKSDKIHRKEECKYCGMITNVSNIARWHDEKCKNNPRNP